MDEELTAESLVDTVISIRKDLEEFQRISSKQELRAALREALKAACKAGEGSPIYDTVLGLFEQRALARPNQIKSIRAPSRSRNTSRPRRRLTFSPKRTSERIWP